MQCVRLVLSLGLFAIFTHSALGQVEFEWKFQDGDAFQLEEVVDVKQTIKLLGQAQEKENVQTTTWRIDVVKAKPDGGADLTMKIEKVEVKGAPENEAVTQRMVGATFDFTLDPQQKITKFDGFEKFVNKIVGGNPAAAQMFRSILSEDTFKQLIQKTFAILPNKKVSKGDIWNFDQAISMGPFGSVAVNRVFRYEGKGEYDGEAYDKFNVQGEPKYQLPEQPGPFFKVVEGSMNFDDMEDDVYFDREAGHLVYGESEVRLTGSLTIEVAGQKSTVDMDQTMKGHVKMSKLDDAP